MIHFIYRHLSKLMTCLNIKIKYNTERQKRFKFKIQEMSIKMGQVSVVVVVMGQWYFTCPTSKRLIENIWKPVGDQFKKIKKGR